VIRVLFCYLSLAGVLLGCSSAPNTTEPLESPTSPSNTTTAIPTIAVTSIPTHEATQPETQALVLWWPDTLTTIEQSEVNDLLNEQINDFVGLEENTVEIDFRIKRYGNELGAIMPTLRSANGIAPGALPDLTLIRRSDLVAAVDAGLIYPLDGLMSASIIGDLYPSTLRLGQVDDRLYGLPYVVDVQHMIYTQDALNGLDGSLDTSFSGILNSGLEWIIPTRRTTGLNLTFYAQYINASGVLPDNDRSALPLDIEALATVLNFYDDMANDGLLNPASLDYSSVNDYAALIVSGGAFDGALVSSNLFLSERYNGRDFVAASIPTQSGQHTGILNGWMWVVTTNNVDRQVVAGRFLNWMMDSTRQAEFAQISRTLPSQQSALQTLDRDIVPVDLYDAILNRAIIILPEPFTSTSARVMQTALMSVLTGESDAAEATQSVIDQLSSSGS
jgi:ABC-type glycerol-3-phosphate transport system substrate-binding protein